MLEMWYFYLVIFNNLNRAHNIYVFSMSVSERRRGLTIQEKINIIKEVESGIKQSEVCRTKSLKKTTVSTIIKNKHKILQFEGKSNDAKRLRKPVRKNIDEALLKWFKCQRSNNIPISGPILQTKAEEFAKLFNEDEFKCTSGWLHRFKQRHNICGSKIHGEAADVNLEEAAIWVQSKLSNLLEEYNANDIFNADETGLFYKLMPDRTLKFKGEKCIGGKQSKIRLTVLLCANMTGCEKHDLVVIGKFQNLRCFKHVKKLPCTYFGNTRAWMTSEIFENVLKTWNKELVKQKRKILLLLDNCPAHPHIDLSNIHLEFLPPNSTSVLQPLDQGVIHTLKSHYRRLVVTQIVQNSNNIKPTEINMLNAVEMLARAWQNVSQETIKNCFDHAWKNRRDFDEDDDIPLTHWLLKHNEGNAHHGTIHLNPRLEGILEYANIQNLEKVDDFVTVDDNLITSEMFTDTDIVNEVIGVENDSSEEEEGEEIEVLPPKYEDAVKGIKTVTRYLESQESGTNEILQAALSIENFLQLSAFVQPKRQTLISDFFNK